MPEKSRRSLLRSLSVAGLSAGLGNFFRLPAHLSLAADNNSFDSPVAPGSPFGAMLTDIAAQAGLNSVCVSGDPETKRWIVETTGCGIAFFDYDQDGWLDILQVSATTLDSSVAPGATPMNLVQNPKSKITNQKSTIGTPTCHLYHNNRDGTFTDVTARAGLTRSGWAQGVCVGDYDNDGWDDLFVTYWGRNSLYHNNGDGTFTDSTFAAGMGLNTRYLGWGCGFADLDNDGWLDVFAAHGHVYPEVERPGADVPYREPKIVYRNLRNGKFEDVSSRAGPGVALLRSGRGVAFGDFDNDGDIDIVVNNVGDPPTLLRNDVDNKNHWLKIKTEGTRSNRSGIGARVRVVAGSHSQIDEVRSGGSYISQNDLRLHFGMGTTAAADLVEIRWPSGQVDRLKNVETNQVVWVKEGSGIMKPSRQ